MENVLITTLLTIVVTILTLSVKSYFEMRKTKYQAKINNTSDSIRAIREAISAIQSMKDSLQIFIEAFEDAMTNEYIINKITSSTEQLVKAYEEYGSYLSQDEVKPFHKAKNLCLRVQPILIGMLKKIDYPSEISTSEKDSIKSIRDELTDLQNILRDFRDARHY